MPTRQGNQRTKNHPNSQLAALLEVLTGVNKSCMGL
jgi:hypothetical protein